MATTAYSLGFQREVDPGQLVALYSGQTHAPVDGSTVFDFWRDRVREDVVCPSCGTSGAQIVKSGRSRSTGQLVRQPHFRFLNASGQDAHSPYCEFYDADDRPSQEPDDLVAFGTSRNRETIALRGLICRAIAAGIFGPAQIREMRQFFFNMKLISRRRVSVTPASVEWVGALGKHFVRHPHGLPFHPSHGELPDFDWREAARAIFSERFKDEIQSCRGYVSGEPVCQRASKLINKYAGEPAIDMSQLQPFYEKTIRLGMFLGRYGGLGYKPGDVDFFWLRGASSPLLALCALLLFIAKWDVDSAIHLFAKIVTAPIPDDQTLGNVIGLNPFADYPAWACIKVAEKVEASRPADQDYKSVLDTIESDLRAQHREWKSGQLR